MKDRFWSKINILDQDSCWIWEGALNKSGYGRFDFGGKSMRAHRVAYELERGPIPEGMLVCHHCDNPPCANPSHLFVGTHRDNAQDAISKGRPGRWGPRREHHSLAKLTEEMVRKIRLDKKKGVNMVEQDETPLRVESAVAYLKAKGWEVSVQTLSRWRSKGKGPNYIKWDGRILYYSSDLNRFAEEQKVVPSEK